MVLVIVMAMVLVVGRAKARDAVRLGPMQMVQIRAGIRNRDRIWSGIGSRFWDLVCSSGDLAIRFWLKLGD